MAVTNTSTSAASRWVNRTRRFLLGSSLVLAAFVAWSYYSRADAFAAVTVFPIWAWLIPGGLLAVLGWRGSPRRLKAAGVLAWAAVAMIFADQPLAVVHRKTPSATAESEQRSAPSLRVISLNCNGGNLAAVRELAAYKPDLLLLQESPSRSRLEEAARELFGEQGSVVWSADASILARGQLTERPLPPNIAARAVWARLELARGGELEVISLRLEPGLVRCDLWSPECWIAQTANRQTRRKQLTDVLDTIGADFSHRSLVIGGDFNAPPGDAIFGSLAPSAHDAFGEAGRGWGNTIVNQFPVLRIDQIWIGDEIRAADAHAIAIHHSDHRAVVCDLLLP